MNPDGLAPKEREALRGDEMSGGRSAVEAGWRESRYNVRATVPGTHKTIVANLFKGTCAAYAPIEMYLLSVLDELDEGHPAIEHFARRGIICKFDERAALESMGRAACTARDEVELTICPTLACNFACPYCFQGHGRTCGPMSREVRDEVVSLAERMLDASGASRLRVTWFGGEPLLAPDVIESLSASLIRLAHGHGASYHAAIVTNGYLLDQDVADMLGRSEVSRATVTIDGLGAKHDETRPLAGGGPTFERIAANLRDVRLPFSVGIQQNVHEGNIGEMAKLRTFVKDLAEESSNRLSYFPALVSDNPAARARGCAVALLEAARTPEVAIQELAARFGPGRGHYCGAQSLYGVAIDPEGNLSKCWETVDQPQAAFGTAREWDPADPLRTATNPDNLTMFLNTASPIPDSECHGCVWLPLCVGGCPRMRLRGARRCVPFRDDPQSFVLALYEKGRTPAGRQQYE